MSERTQHQSSDEIKRARKLSLEATRPPAEVPGYKLQQFLGSGAFGEVWSATDLTTGRRVAVKFYTRRSPADVQLLAQEVEKLAVLSNDRYVVQLLDVGWKANPPYYVMEFIEHGSLEDRLENGNVLGVHKAVELFQDISSGMMRLHGKGILHCDLKPGNVLLDQDGKPRVADFGQSRLSTDETPALGTLFYMAPEQADMDAVPDAGWDVYGLGAMLFTMLTGRPPYYCSDLAKRIDSTTDIEERLETYREVLLASPPPTEHRQVDGVDRSLADLIDRCIAADPKRRFNNIHSILLALQQREMARARRPVMLLGLIGPLLLLGVVTLFGGWAFNQSLSQTKLAVTAKAQQSNDFAAMLAARSAADQIDEYFRVVRQLARDKQFLSAFNELLADKGLESVRIQLADPRLNASDGKEVDKTIGALRTKFKASETPQRLQQFLDDRLDDPEHEYPAAASWFVCDRMGNQLASAFRTENLTLANNYSFRTYFTGEDRDLAMDAPGISKTDYSLAALSQRKIISAPNLSAVFVSEQSKTWKVAFSAPVKNFNQSKGMDEVIGIVAVTVELGNLVEFENAPSQYAMLLDNRPGENTGVVLEHPLFTEILQQRGSLPDQFVSTKIDVDLAQTEFPFQDPVGETDLGIKNGYLRDSIVSVVPVFMQQAQGRMVDGEMSAGGRRETGLVVLAVQDYENVLSSVNELETQLRWLAVMAGMLLLGVSISLWFFVNRMLKETRDRLTDSLLQSTESSVFQEMETMHGGGPLTTSHPSNRPDGSDD